MFELTKKVQSFQQTNKNEMKSDQKAENPNVSNDSNLMIDLLIFIKQTKLN